MAELYASVDGQVVPLRQCDWVFAYGCGHPFGVLLAEITGPAGRAYATEEQAWREHYPRARDRRAAQRRGVTVRLAVYASLDDEFWQWMKDGCQCNPGVNRRGR